MNSSSIIVIYTKQQQQNDINSTSVLRVNCYINRIVASQKNHNFAQRKKLRKTQRMVAAHETNAVTTGLTTLLEKM